MTSAPPDVDTASHDEEIRLSGFGWWALGGALGTAVTLVVAFALLMGLTSRPEYTGREEVAAAGVAGEAVAAITLLATEFAFDPNEFTAFAAAEVSIDNRGSIFHNLAIEGVPEAEFLVEADPGAVGTAALTVEPGTYTFFCSVPGHREAGMVGELVVVAES